MLAKPVGMTVIKLDGNVAYGLWHHRLAHASTMRVHLTAKANAVSGMEAVVQCKPSQAKAYNAIACDACNKYGMKRPAIGSTGETPIHMSTVAH